MPSPLALFSRWERGDIDSHVHGFLCTSGPRAAADRQADRVVRGFRGGDHRGGLRGRLADHARGRQLRAGPARLGPADPLEPAALGQGGAGHDRGDLAGQLVQGRRAGLGRRGRGADDGRPARRSADNRPGGAPPVERGGRDGAGLRRAGAAGVRAGPRALDQRLCRRLPAWRRRGGRLAGLPAIPHPRGAARRAGPRVQPPPQRRHAAQPPPGGHRLRDPRALDHRLFRDALGRFRRLLLAGFRLAAATTAPLFSSSAWRSTSWAISACSWAISSRPPSPGSGSSWPTPPACSSPATPPRWRGP